MKKILLAAISTVAITAMAQGADAAAFGIFGSGTGGSSTSNAAAAATAQGHTASILANLSAASLAGEDVLWVLNGSNGAQAGELSTNAAAVSAFVSGGGVLIYSDRRVSGAEGVLPGAGGITFTRDFSFGARIDIETVYNPLITGPGGTITNSTLDGGNSSSHGFAMGIPGGGIGILNNSVPGNLVDFFYGFGSGQVYYSSIPIDFYLIPTGANGASFRNIYVPNLVATAAGLVGGAAPAPEPAGWALMIGGFAMAGAALRRRRALAA